MPKIFGPAIFVREIGADKFLDFCENCVIPSFLITKNNYFSYASLGEGCQN